MDIQPAREMLVAKALLLELGWTRVTFSTNARRYEVVIEHVPPPAMLRTLSHKEFSVLRLTAEGRSSKEIAAELSIAAATSRGILDRALDKLGLANSSQAPLFWTALQSPGYSSRIRGGGKRFMFACDLETVTLRELSRCERALAIGVLLGESNLEIARRRQVSIRTVANQLHGMFRKLHVSSRTELGAALLRKA